MRNFETDESAPMPRNRGTEKTQKAGRFQTKSAPRRKRRKPNNLLWLLAAVAVLILLLVFLLRGCAAGDVLTGQWRIDEITAYQFDGNGKGMLILPDKTYGFTYVIEENSLSIDFESSSARDFQYTFEISGDHLTLTGGEGKETVTYELTKDKG